MSAQFSTRFGPAEGLTASTPRAHEMTQKWGVLAFFLDPDGELRGADVATTAVSAFCMVATTFVHGAMSRKLGGGGGDERRMTCDAPQSRRGRECSSAWGESSRAAPRRKSEPQPSAATVTRRLRLVRTRHSTPGGSAFECVWKMMSAQHTLRRERGQWERCAQPERPSPVDHARHLCSYKAVPRRTPHAWRGARSSVARGRGRDGFVFSHTYGGLH